MNDGRERYSRQIRLPEVGEAGQERIRRCVAEVRGRDGALVELSYLERAGVGAAELTLFPEPVPFAHAAAFRFDAARRVGAGAWRALGTLKRALELPDPRRTP
jgi:hypothetical protein